MEENHLKTVGTFRYGKLLSKPALVVQWAVVAVSIAFLTLFGYALSDARGDMAVIVGWIFWGIWLLAAVKCLAESVADLFNRRLIARCLKSGDLQEAASVAFSAPFPLFRAKVTVEILLFGGTVTKTFRLRDRSFLRELQAGRMALRYSPSRNAVLVLK